ncbi:hypothetical protein [Azospirillum endophyticum]
MFRVAGFTRHQHPQAYAGNWGIVPWRGDGIAASMNKQDVSKQEV